MIDKIGYACINTSIDAKTNSTCRLANCSEKRLRELIESNLKGLIDILNWNIRHNIRLFRISSDIIPFASHEINKIDWHKENLGLFIKIEQIIKENSLRVSMHPGQYVNLNSNNIRVVEDSVREIDWHVKFLDNLNLDASHRIIIHVGGVYGNKQEAVKRFINIYNTLPSGIKDRLTLENDDKSYTVSDVLKIFQKTSIPVVFDLLHYKVNHEKNEQNLEELLKSCFLTWNEYSGIPKVHFSSQKIGAKPGVHSFSVNLDEFMEFYLKFKKHDFDIMIETKDKEQSVLRILDRINKPKKI